MPITARLLESDCMVHKIWGMVHNIWGMANNIWGMAHNIWGMAHDFWGKAHDIWGMAHNIWGMAHNILSILHNIWGMACNIWGMAHNFFSHSTINKKKKHFPLLSHGMISVAAIFTWLRPAFLRRLLEQCGSNVYVITSSLPPTATTAVWQQCFSDNVHSTSYRYKSSVAAVLAFPYEVNGLLHRHTYVETDVFWLETRTLFSLITGHGMLSTALRCLL